MKLIISKKKNFHLWIFNFTKSISKISSYANSEIWLIQQSRFQVMLQKLSAYNVKINLLLGVLNNIPNKFTYFAVPVIALLIERVISVFREIICNNHFQFSCSLVYFWVGAHSQYLSYKFLLYFTWYYCNIIVKLKQEKLVRIIFTLH